MRNCTIIIMTVFGSFVTWPLKAMPVEKIIVKGGPVKYHDKHLVLKSFEITMFEITNEQYARFLNSKEIAADGMFKERLLINISSKDLQLVFAENQWAPKEGYENYPMVMVNYFGAAAFCDWVGGRLPTETEWYYAASGGQKSGHYTYAGGNSADESAWYSGNSHQSAHPVGQKKPNELGIYDMSGNVWEWCQNDSLKTDTDFCVHMGGSWYAGEKAAQLDAHFGNTPLHFSNSVGFRVIFPLAAFLADEYLLSGQYKGKPWNGQPQGIPGKIECEFYDQGGEGIAYHDQDSVNNGSGKLNPANGTFLNEFRMREGVDISYTKTKAIDDNPFNLVEPSMEQFYVGWTVPGEWINYSVRVDQTGSYMLGIMYTASGNGSIALWLDGKKITNELMIPSTRNKNEIIAWRQWHHWNRIDDLVTCQLQKGLHVLTLQTVSNGNMNYDYLAFKLKD